MTPQPGTQPKTAESIRRLRRKGPEPQSTQDNKKAVAACGDASRKETIPPPSSGTQQEYILWANCNDQRQAQKATPAHRYRSLTRLQHRHTGLNLGTNLA